MNNKETYDVDNFTRLYYVLVYMSIMCVDNNSF